MELSNTPLVYDLHTTVVPYTHKFLLCWNFCGSFQPSPQTWRMIIASGQWPYCLYRSPLRTCHERSLALSRKPSFLQQQLPICHCKLGIHAGITFFSELSSHLSIKQTVKVSKFSWRPIFMGGFNHENLTPRNLTHEIFHPRKFLRIRRLYTS